MSTAVKCPVCEGRGTVPADFYTRTPSTGDNVVACNTCHGQGIVILADNPVIIPPYVPPYEHYPRWDPWNPFNRPMIMD